MEIIEKRLPAILGGEPLFSQPLRISSPHLTPLPELLPKLREIWDTGQITNARYVEELERTAATYLGAKHVVAVASCTLGLVLVEKALGLKGEVVVPSFTFCATAHSLMWNGLRPVFADCDPATHNITAVTVEPLIGPSTSAILAVDVFGNPCDRKGLAEIARQRGLKLVIDAAHSFGARYAGSNLGETADAQVFSLSPTKVLVAGEGGLIATSDEELANDLVIARNYGNPGDYDSLFPGLNARMSEFHGILGAANLPSVDSVVTERNRLAKAYIEELSRIPGISFQSIHKGSISTYKDFSIVVDEAEFGLSRDELARSLGADNIETRPYYSPPVHRQRAYREFLAECSDRLPHSDSLASKALSLPLYVSMGDDVVRRVSASVAGIHKNAAAIADALHARAIE